MTRAQGIDPEPINLDGPDVDPVSGDEAATVPDIDDTGRVFDTAVVRELVNEGVGLQFGKHDNEPVEVGMEAVVRFVLDAAADALEGAIRAEVLAPVVELVAEMADANRENGTMPGVRMQVCRYWAARLRVVLANPDAAVAKHNAAIWDEGVKATLAWATLGRDAYVYMERVNPYRATEPKS